MPGEPLDAPEDLPKDGCRPAGGDTTRILADYRTRVASALGRSAPTSSSIPAGPPPGPADQGVQRDVARGLPAGGLYWHSLARPSSLRGDAESVAMKISSLSTAAVLRRCHIISDQDVRDTRDRWAQFGHNQAAKVVRIAR
jgi:hypothetical protein